MEIVIYLALLAIIIPAIYAAIVGAPTVPSIGKNIDKALREAGVSKNTKFYELGTGTGKVSRKALMMGAAITGYELSPLAYLWSFIALASTGKPFELKFGNFFKADLRDADVVYIFLVPETMKRTANKLRKEIRSGSRVISYAFPIEGWTPSKIISGDKEANIYIYEASGN